MVRATKHQQMGHIGTYGYCLHIQFGDFGSDFNPRTDSDGGHPKNPWSQVLLDSQYFYLAGAANTVVGDILG